MTSVRLPLFALGTALAILVSGIVFYQRVANSEPSADQVILSEESQGEDPFRDPPGGWEPTPITEQAIVEELRRNLENIPDDRKIVISPDIIGVKGSSDVHDLSAPPAVTLHHIPSRTVISIDQAGNEISRTVRGVEGVKPLEDVLADPGKRAAILAFLAE